MQKSAYPNEYMDDWEKFSERSLPEKEDFYSHVNTKGITDASYTHAKRICKDSEKIFLGEYYDLYFRTDTLSLADV